MGRGLVAGSYVFLGQFAAAAKEEEEGQSSESYEEIFSEVASAAIPEVIPELPEPDLSGIDLGQWFDKVVKGISKFFEDFEIGEDD